MNDFRENAIFRKYKNHCRFNPPLRAKYANCRSIMNLPVLTMLVVTLYDNRKAIR
jgi:hypothetical protein